MLEQPFEQRRGLRQQALDRIELVAHIPSAYLESQLAELA